MFYVGKWNGNASIYEPINFLLCNLVLIIQKTETNFIINYCWFPDEFLQRAAPCDWNVQEMNWAAKCKRKNENFQIIKTVFNNFLRKNMCRLWRLNKRLTQSHLHKQSFELPNSVFCSRQFLIFLYFIVFLWPLTSLNEWNIKIIPVSQ